MIKEGLWDIIAAISTPMGIGAIGIVRMTGDGAIALAEKVFKNRHGKRLTDVTSHTMTLGNIVDPTSGQIIDEALVSVMNAPNTYTAQDVVEFNCHGGMLAVKETLALLLRCGARIAEPGEFTKRAFLNGRLDLSQAEAVIDLIHAKTNLNLQTAVGQLSGRLTNQIKQMRQELLDMIAGIEASIDYPEYEVEAETRNILLEKAENMLLEMNRLFIHADRGKILREGLETVIVGKPNVGKSSLLNWFLNEDRAIVTDIAGTTRDTVEEYFNLDGIPIKIVDTAGIRNTEDLVEKIGVEKTKEYAKKADLLLILIDQSRPLTEEDADVLKMAEHKHALVLINKMDLPNAADISSLNVPNTNLVPISVKQNKGFEELSDKLKEMFFSGSDINADMAILGNTRHKNALFHAKASLEKAVEAIRDMMPEDFISMDLQQANDFLGEITGDTVDEEVIDRIFTRFCLGK